MGRGFGGISFAPQGLRTDGRPHRAQSPWRLNTGAETANPARAAYTPNPRTNFDEAFKFRLGGLTSRKLDFSAKPIAPTSTLGATDQRAKNDLNSGGDPNFWNHMAARERGGVFDPATGTVRTNLGGRQSLGVPSDNADADFVPMFGGVSDAGAEVKNTAQRWAQAVAPEAGGWTVTKPAEVQAIRQQYGTPPMLASTSDGGLAY